MKILKIVLTNLNSLRGTHIVDFETEPLASGGLFAITGPTGAGKTTLLDAMTLALYGQAARYSKKNDQENMMSRHTGECSAEVTFRVASGRYRAEWKLKRARSKPDGNMQTAKRYLYDANDDVLAQSVKEVNEGIEKLVGLNYDRFLRSVLLAQGDFALFLEADTKERAEILESLTGTVIYSELGTLAFEEERRRTNELNVQKEALGQTVLLTEDERAEKTLEMTAKSETQKGQQNELKMLNDKLGKSNDLVKALNGEQQCLADQTTLAEKRKAHEPDLQKLAEHNATLPFTADLSNLTAAESTFSEQEAHLKQADTDRTKAQHEWLRGLVSATKFSKQLITVSEADVAHWKGKKDSCETNKQCIEAWLEKEAQDKTLTTALPEISTQLSQLDSHRISVISSQVSLEKITTGITVQYKAIEEFTDKWTKAKEHLTATDEKQASASTGLNNILNGKTKDVYQEELEQLRILERGIDQLALKAENVAKQQASIAKQRINLDELKPQIEAAQQKEKHANEARAAAEEQRDLRQDHLDKAKLIASLEERRAELKEGAECPLCGSTEHPLITGESKPTAMYVLQDELNKAKISLKENEDVCRSIEKNLAGLLSAQKRLTETTEVADKEVAAAKSDIQELAVLHQLKDVDIETMNVARETQTVKIKILKQRLVEIEAAMAAVTACEKEQSDAGHQVELLWGKVKSGNEALDNLQETQENVKDEIAKLQEKANVVSKELIASLKPYQVSLPEAGFEKSCQEAVSARSTEYQKQNTQLNATSASLDRANNQLEKSEAELISLQGKSTPFNQEASRNAKIIQETGIKESQELLTNWQKVEDAEKSLQELRSTYAATETTYTYRLEAKARDESKLQALTVALTERIGRYDFTTINELRMSQLESETVQELEKLKKNLQSEEDQLKGAIEQRRTEIKGLRAAKVAEGEEALELTTRQTELQKDAAALSEQIGAMKNALQRDDESRKTHAAKRVKIEDSEKRLKVWVQLRNLIGSLDGKKFSSYAQGISLGILVFYANQHLQRLSKRYTMRRHSMETLDLEIIDHDQADAARPMASLSGGEKFITSLALALGLASMAGRNTKIDSLFIDEGFGSLDGDSLDLAISALESLRANNKTIGVISHVDLLKERIAVRIEVQKKSGGVSTLSIIPSMKTALVA